MVPRAQLKVFSPLEAFPPHERDAWRAYVEADRGLTRRQVVELESGTAAARLIGGRSTLGPQAALIRRAGRRILVCPLQLDLRSALALESFRRSVPESIFDAFLPPAGRLGGLEDLSASGRLPHVLDEPWAVPLPWFVAFAPEERRFTNPLEGAGPRLVYLTTCDQAAARLDRAVQIVESTVEDGEDVLMALAEIASWIDHFDPRSLLELDYGRLVELFVPAELEADRTCEELHRALDALEAGDLLAAAAGYGVARARWTARRAKEHAS